MGNSPCLRGTSASAGRQHHPPPSRCRGHHSGSAQPPLSHCSPTLGVQGEPPRPRHFVSPRAGGAAAGLGLAALLRAEPPTEGRRRPADAAPRSPTQPGGTAVQPQGTHRTSDSNIWLLHIPAATRGRREDTAESRGLATEIPPPAGQCVRAAEFGLQEHLF